MSRCIPKSPFYLQEKIHREPTLYIFEWDLLLWCFVTVKILTTITDYDKTRQQTLLIICTLQKWHSTDHECVLTAQKDSALKVADCTFTNNSARFGGAIIAKVGARNYSSGIIYEWMGKLLWYFSVSQPIEFSHWFCVTGQKLKHKLLLIQNLLWNLALQLASK